MTTDKLRKDAEMVVATGMHKDWADSIDAGAVRVCRDWLRLHPADDGEAVTPDWLRSIGFKDYVAANEWCEAYLSFWMDRREHNAAILSVHWARPTNPQGSYWTANGFSLYKAAYPQTRGAVRRLLAALGTTPREPA